MTFRIRTVGAATALAMIAGTVPHSAAAQEVPPCSGDAASMDLQAALGAGLSEAVAALGGGADLPRLLSEGRLCMNAAGELALRQPDAAPVQAEAPAAEAPAAETPPPVAEEAAAPAAEAAPEAAPAATPDVAVETPPVQAEVEAEATVETEAPAEQPAAAPVEAETVQETETEAEAETAAETAQPAPTQPPAQAEAAEAETAQPAPTQPPAQAEAAEAETAQPAPAQPPAQTEAAETDKARELREALEAAGAKAESAPEPVQPVVPAETTAETKTETKTDTTGTQAETTAEAETETVNEPAPEVAEGRPVTVAAGSETEEAEVAETTLTTVTEEDARSSDEDFAKTPPTAGERERDGLSNFERFALGAAAGAAGAIIIDQLLGENSEVVRNTGDRVVVRRDNGDLYILKDDDVLLRRPGSDVKTETFSDGSSRTTVTRPDGVKVITISAADGRVLRRVRLLPDGRQVVLFDDTQGAEPVDVSRLPSPAPAPAPAAGLGTDRDALVAALEAERYGGLDRRFTLAQVRNIVEVRELMPEVVLDAINFETGSAAISPEEARDLLSLGEAMKQVIDERPGELFLIEGHTDAVGDPSMNLALSDRRAESVALALTEYFGVPPENMIVQGYGESHLLIPTLEAERANRRATVRRITPLLTVASN